MTAEEFLAWRLDRQGTWELVDGQPRLKFDNGPRLMAGGTWAHALVASNIVSALRPRLRGSRCRAVGSDYAVQNGKGGVRQPDVTVECGRPKSDDLRAAEPAAVFEVLSPSTRGTDLIKKTDEYKRLPTLRHIVLLEADQAKALVWTREGDDWRIDEVAGLDGELSLTGVDVSLPMAELYEEVELDEAG